MVDRTLPSGIPGLTATVLPQPNAGFGVGVREQAPTPPKPVNPKDGLGTKKLPFHLWPPSASAHGCLALLDGMLKYGRTNWRATDVRATVYIGAALRHILEYLEGADADETSGLHPLAHVLACCAIILDAKATGTLIDDRNYPSDYHTLLKELTPHVERLIQQYAELTDVKHYTIQDSLDV